MNRRFVAGISITGLVIAATGVLWTVQTRRADAHCQVPCGIYDDAARIVRMLEDTATINKAMKQINQLSGKHDALALNQAVRWINTKELHATHIIDVVSEYFLTQKLKPVARGADGYNAYLQKLADHHTVMAAAMKTKQTTDTDNADKLHHAIEQLGSHYKK